MWGGGGVGGVVGSGCGGGWGVVGLLGVGCVVDVEAFFLDDFDKSLSVGGLCGVTAGFKSVGPCFVVGLIELEQ